MSHLGIPKHNFIDYNLHQLGYIQSIRRHYRPYNEQPVFLDIIKKIDENEAFQSIKGQNIILGNMIIEAHAHIFAEWYLYYANEFGIEKAEEYLNSYFNREYNISHIVLWVTGITVERTIQLEDGIKIIPLTEMPISEEKIFYEKLFNGMPFHSLPKCALVGTSTYPKFESEKKHFKATGISMGQLMTMAFSINLLNEMICAPYLSTFYYFDHPSFFNGGGGTVHQGYYTSFNYQTIEINNIEEINKTYKSLFQLPEKQRNVFMTSINRLLLAKCQRNIENKILDLCIALEMLLLSDNKQADQLSLSFRLRGAWLIGETSEQKRNYYNDLRDLYTHRSKVAHTGFLTDKPSKYKEITDAFPRYLDLAEKIIKKLLNDGTPDWNNLILG